MGDFRRPWKNDITFTGVSDAYTSVNTTVVDVVATYIEQSMSDIEPDDDGNVVSSIVDTTVPFVSVRDVVLSSVATFDDSNMVPYVVARSPITISDDSDDTQLGEALFMAEENLAGFGDIPFGLDSVPESQSQDDGHFLA